MYYKRRNLARRPRQPNRNPRKGKRWNFSATIGKNVPLLGGTGIRFGNRAVRRTVRSEIARQEETKQLQLTWSSGTSPSASNLYCNTMYTFAPTQLITQGTAGNNRTGDAIYLKHILNKLTVDTNLAVTKIRCVGLWMEQNFAVSNGFQAASGIGSSSIFFPTSVSLADALINNKLGNQVVCDRKIVIVNPNPGSYTFKSFNVDCPVNKKCQYTSGGTLFKDMQFYMIVLLVSPQVANGTNWSTSNNVHLGYDTIVTFRDA